MTIQARLDWLELEIGSSIDAHSGKATWADINRRENQLSSTSDGRNNAKKFLPPRPPFKLRFCWKDVAEGQSYRGIDLVRPNDSL